MAAIVNEEKLALQILKLAVEKQVEDRLEEIVQSVYDSIGMKNEDGSRGMTVTGGTLDKEWPQMKALILKYAAEKAGRLALDAVPRGTLV